MDSLIAAVGFLAGFFYVPDQAHHWLPPADGARVVRIGAGPTGAVEGPIAIVYAEKDGILGADACLRFWSDGRWTVAVEADKRDAAGFYNHEIASGRVDPNGRAVGRLETFFADAQGIWRSGLERTDVFIGGIPVPPT